MLGHAKKVTVSKDNTIIVDGGGEKQAIADRVAQIKSEITNTTSSYDKEKLQERLAKLAGGVAVLYVGANSEVEMKEKKDRVDDALCATRAATEEACCCRWWYYLYPRSRGIGRLEAVKTTMSKLVSTSYAVPLKSHYARLFSTLVAKVL